MNTATRRDYIKLFESLGVSFSVKNSKQCVGTAPWSDKPNKFYCHPRTGQWDEKQLGNSGNYEQFLAHHHEVLHKERSLAEFKQLARWRGLPQEALTGWGFVTDGLYVYDPVCIHNGKLVELRRCPLKGTERKWMGSAGFPLDISGWDRLVKAKPGSRVFLTEGAWDGCALQWLARKAGQRITVLALPGASSFKPEWAQKLAGFDVTLCYDNDNAGAKGEVRARNALVQYGVHPHFLTWDDDWPEGYDLNDFVRWGIENGVSPRQMWAALEKRCSTTPRTATSESAETASDEQDPGPEEGDCPSFAETNAIFAQHFRWSPDLELALTVVFAVAFAAKVPGTKLFLFLIGTPGSGKTELVDKLDAGTFALVSSTITPRALVSGQAGPNDPSLLPKLNGKCWVVKDYTELLSKHSLDLEEINSTLRGAFDGQVRKDFGNGIIREYRDLHFSHIAAVTPIINGRNMSSLGERYLKLQLEPQSLGDLTDFLMEVSKKSKDEPARQKTLREAVRQFLRRPVGPATGLPQWPESLKRCLAALAQVTAKVRTQVDREAFGERSLRSRPASEFPTRLFKQLLLLGQLVAFVLDKPRVDEDVYRVCERVGFDTAVGFGLDVLQAMHSTEGKAAVWQLEESLGLPSTTIRRVLDDLHLVGLVQRRKKAGPRPPDSERASAPDLWVMEAQFADLWKKAGVRGNHSKRLAANRGGAYTEAKRRA